MDSEKMPKTSPLGTDQTSYRQAEKLKELETEIECLHKTIAALKKEALVLLLKNACSRH